MKKCKNVISIIMILSLSFTITACGNETEITTITTTQQAIDNNIDNSQSIDTLSPVETSAEGAVDTTKQQLPSTNSVSQNANQTASNSTTVAQTTQASSTEKTETNQAPQVTDGVGKYTSAFNSTEQAVYYPSELTTSVKTYPIVAFANGTMVSYTFYETLLKEFAKIGYIVVGNSETMSGDGKAQIASIDFIISENSNPSSVLYGKVNTEKIAVVGHSQGGRSSVNAAAADPRIDCVLSIAGSNYVEEAEKLSTPTLFMAGTKDMIVDADRWVKTAYDASKGPAVYVNYIGGIHTTCCSNPAPYVHYASLWFDAYLNGNTATLDKFRTGGELSSDSAWSEFSCKGF